MWNISVSHVCGIGIYPCVTHQNIPQLLRKTRGEFNQSASLDGSPPANRRPSMATINEAREAGAPEYAAQGFALKTRTFDTK